MTELKSAAAEQALAEHLAATRKDGGESATNYHHTITDLRRELMGSSLMFDKMGGPHREIVYKWLEAHRADPETPRPPQVEFDADSAAMMASSYAYALAAILRFAGTHFGDEVARGLAFEMDEILTNGDFDNLNADVLPEGANSPSATQGLEFVIGAPAAASGE